MAEIHYGKSLPIGTKIVCPNCQRELYETQLPLVANVDTFQVKQFKALKLDTISAKPLDTPEVKVGEAMVTTSCPYCRCCWTRNQNNCFSISTEKGWWPQ